MSYLMNSEDWQTCLPSLKQRIEHVFKNSLFCDVEFSVVDEAGSKHLVPANKFMLATTSPVFAAMFYGTLAEDKSTIDLPDCSMEGLTEMLRYVHCEEVALTPSNVVETLYIAEKYMMPFLVEKCRQYIKSQLEPEQVFAVLPKLKAMNDKELEGCCWEIIDSKTLKVVNSESFLLVSRDTLCETLSREGLVIKELDLFLAVNKWVSKRIVEKELENCGKSKRSVLGEDALRLIRFPLISHKEFAEFVLPTEVLTMTEVVEVCQLSSSIKTVSSMFSCKERAFSSKLKIKLRFETMQEPNNGSWWYDGRRVDALDFIVSKPVLLAGVELFASRAFTYTVELSICRKSKLISFVCLKTVAHEDKIDGMYHGVDVYFDRPVTLAQGCRYGIKATISGPASYYGEDGKSEVQEGDLVVSFFKSKDNEDSHTDPNRGQFGRLIILMGNNYP